MCALYARVGGYACPSCSLGTLVVPGQSRSATLEHLGTLVVQGRSRGAILEHSQSTGTIPGCHSEVFLEYF